MHLRAVLNGILSPITYHDLTPGKLEEQPKVNLPADPKEVKKVKRLIRLAKEEEQGRQAHIAINDLFSSFDEEEQ